MKKLKKNWQKSNECQQWREHWHQQWRQHDFNYIGLRQGRPQRDRCVVVVASDATLRQLWMQHCRGKFSFLFFKMFFLNDLWQVQKSSRLLLSLHEREKERYFIYSRRRHSPIPTLLVGRNVQAQAPSSSSNTANNTTSSNTNTNTNTNNTSKRNFITRSSKEPPPTTPTKETL